VGIGSEAPQGGLRILFSAAEIAARVDTLAADIARTVPTDFVMVGLLKGAAVFVADLARALDRAGARPEIEFMRLSSYGSIKESSGAVQLVGDIPAGLAGRSVLLVDDIVDTGRSIAYAAVQLRQCGIGDLWLCALVDKPQRREIAVAIDFIGFSIGNVFVVGYGTDYAEKYRHLPYIGVLE
jgi:hypoxanthine phosphoribosyltransferase